MASVALPIAATQDDLDWEEVALDCARVILDYRTPIEAAVAKVVSEAVRSARKGAGPSWDFTLRFAAFLTPVLMEFAFQQLAEYADVELPERKEDEEDEPIVGDAPSTQGSLDISTESATADAHSPLWDDVHNSGRQWDGSPF